MRATDRCPFWKNDVFKKGKSMSPLIVHCICTMQMVSAIPVIFLPQSPVSFPQTRTST